MTGIETARARPVLATLTGLIAVHALAGAAGLGVGVLDAGPRLPWHSTLLAGLALALVVGVPMTVASVLLARGSRHADRVAAVAGAVLIAWIGLELLVLREPTWLQPVFLVAGVIVLVTGLRGRSPR